jgi:thioredoxin reductase (NADPH)
MDTDVVVVGGGSAGLQAALTLGRMRFDVVVIDAGSPSNAPAHAIGGLLGAHDVGPLDLLATGRAQLAELPSVRLVDGEVTRVEAGRTVTLADGTGLAARAVVLATGAQYAVPDAPGLAELWGESVVHCPYGLPDVRFHAKGGAAARSARPAVVSSTPSARCSD